MSGGDSRSFALVNASPDILAQIRANPALQPARAPRDTAVCGAVLVDGQLDHTVGLLMLRESRRPLRIWCTDPVYADLTRGNPLLRVLAHYCAVERHAVSLDGSEFVVDGVGGVHWRALAVAGRPARYSPHRHSPVAGDSVALVLREERDSRMLVYAPGLAAMDGALWSAIQAAQCVLIDGTFWSDDEMIRLGVSQKRARDIGHLPLDGPGGMLEWLEKLPATVRRVLVHVNNTNPILDESSPEHAELVRRRVEVAHDGLDIEL